MILTKKRNHLLLILLVLFLTISASGFINVSNAVSKPTKMTVKATATTVDIKGKVKVYVKSVSPKNASKAVTFKSSNKAIATVSSKGIVTGKKKGTVKITVTSKKNKKLKKTVKITVKDLKSTSISINKPKKSVPAGYTSKLTATVKGSTGYYNQGVVWSSSDPAIADVTDDGTVIGNAEGTAEIYATEKNGTRTATCALTVTPFFIKGQKEIGFGDFTWDVLEVNETGVLLITSQIVENRQYSEAGHVVTWSDSQARIYLNNQFLNTHFTKEEADRIYRVTNRTEDNVWYGTNGGGNVLDTIFLLSVEDVVKYWGDSGQLDAGIPASGKAIINDSYNSARIAKKDNKNAAWWLRSSGNDPKKVCYVSADGYISMGGQSAEKQYGYRPALWIRR